MSSFVLRHRSGGVPQWSVTGPVIMPTLFGEGYGIYKTRRSTFLVSFLAHAIAIGLLFASGRFVVAHRAEVPEQVMGTVTEVSPYILPPSASKAGGGGGGGERDKLAASKGALPRFSWNQLAPPAVVIRNENPKLPVEPTVVVPPTIHMPIP